MDYSFKSMTAPQPQEAPLAQEFIPPPDNSKLTPEEVAEAQMIYQQMKSPAPAPMAPKQTEGWGKV